MAEIGAGLGLWQGKYKRFTREWLRWYNDSGWILTSEEAEKAKNRVLEQKLKELGVSMDDLNLN